MVVKRSALSAAVIAAGLGAAIWALSISITGKEEPWDADWPFYSLALLVGGAISGALVPRHLGMHYLGVVLGQLAYQLAFLKLGPLFIVGFAFLIAYSFIFVAGVAIGRLFRKVPPDEPSTASPGDP
jgi:hypothetical protein